VLPPSPGAVLLAALLAGAAQAAEPPPVPRCAATARFDLSAGSPEVAPEVCASADEPTAFVFDSRVAGGRWSFSQWDASRIGPLGKTG